MSQIITDKETIEAVLRAAEEGGRITHFFPDRESVLNRFQSGEKFRFYFGIDPTGPTLHIGHTIPLMLLKGLASLGHQITLLIGDFTARIGDPTDKSAARAVLSTEEVEQNMLHYIDQVHKILKEDSFDVVYNSSWLNDMSFKDVIELASKVSVQQMLERDMFQDRQKNKKPIYIHEFLYPLMQGYDSVSLQADGEIGGNDQVFNMLIGRDLEKDYLKKDKVVLATRLLVSETGKKMSKSEGTMITLSDTPRDMFGKIMSSVPDTMIVSYFELATGVCDTEEGRAKIKEWEMKSKEDSTNYRDFKLALAYEITSMYHGKESADLAQKEFGSHEAPGDIQSFTLSGDNKLINVLIDSGFIASKSEVRRLIEQKGISINQEKIEDQNTPLKEGDIIQIGSHRFLKIN